MGIQGLAKLIKINAPDAIKETTIGDYRNRILVKDISNILYRICISMRKNGENNMRTRQGKITSHLHAIFNTVKTCLLNDITPVYIFDGKAPDHKRTTIQKRKNATKMAKIQMTNSDLDRDKKVKAYVNSFEISGQMYSECKTLLALLGIPYIQSPQEADSQCASMTVKNSGIAGSVTEDLDHLVFGAKTVLKNFKTNAIIKEISLEHILTSLDITYENFVDICVLNGIEKLPKIKGMRQQSIVRRYKEVIEEVNGMSEENRSNKYIHLKMFIKSLKRENTECQRNGKKVMYLFPYDFLQQCIKLKDYFEQNARIRHIEQEELKVGEVNQNELFKFLVEENGFSKYKVHHILNVIKCFKSESKEKFKKHHSLKYQCRSYVRPTFNRFRQGVNSF